MTSVKTLKEFFDDDETYNEALGNLKSMLNQGIVQIQYLKMDGSLREAEATLEPAMIPLSKVPVGETADLPTAKFTRYFDLGANDWRSFINEKVVQFQWSGKTHLVARPELLNRDKPVHV